MGADVTIIHLEVGRGQKWNCFYHLKEKHGKESKVYFAHLNLKLFFQEL